MRPASARTRSRASGSSRARAVTVNERTVEVFFARPVLRMMIQQPLVVANRDTQYDVICTVSGGGLSGQAGAVRHGISKALTYFEPDLRGVAQAGRLPHPRLARGRAQEVRPRQGPPFVPVLEALSFRTSIAERARHWRALFYSAGCGSCLAEAAQQAAVDGGKAAAISAMPAMWRSSSFHRGEDAERDSRHRHQERHQHQVGGAGGRDDAEIEQIGDGGREQRRPEHGAASTSRLGTAAQVHGWSMISTAGNSMADDTVSRPVALASGATPMRAEAAREHAGNP